MCKWNGVEEIPPDSGPDSFSFQWYEWEMDPSFTIYEVGII